MRMLPGQKPEDFKSKPEYVKSMTYEQIVEETNGNVNRFRDEINRNFDKINYRIYAQATLNKIYLVWLTLLTAGFIWKLI